MPLNLFRLPSLFKPLECQDMPFGSQFHAIYSAWQKLGVQCSVSCHGRPNRGEFFLAQLVAEVDATIHNLSTFLWSNISVSLVMTQIDSDLLNMTAIYPF